MAYKMGETYLPLNRTSLSRKFLVKNCTLLGNFAVSSLADVSEQPIGPIFKGQEPKNHYSLCNSPEDHSSHLLRGESLKSQILRRQNSSGVLPHLSNRLLDPVRAISKKTLTE